jgi:low temperature requirement protein LtrA
MLTAALWWVYFDEDIRRAEASLKAAALDARVRTGLMGYFYAYIPVLLGIVCLAAGVKLTLGSVGERVALAPAVLLAGGVAVYLLGDVAFGRAMGIPTLRFRVAGTLVALAVTALGLFLGGNAELVGLLLTLMAMLMAERHFETRGVSEALQRGLRDRRTART